MFQTMGNVPKDLIQFLADQDYSRFKVVEGPLCAISVGVYPFDVSITVGLYATGIWFEYIFKTRKDAVESYICFDSLLEEPEGYIVRRGIGYDYNPSAPDSNGKRLKYMKREDLFGVLMPAKLTY